MSIHKTRADATWTAFTDAVSLGKTAQQAWEDAANAAINWQPPPEPTLGKVCYDAYRDRFGFSGSWPEEGKMQEAWQAAGEAAAAVGAARERAEMRKKLQGYGAICGTKSSTIIDDLTKWLDARDLGTVLTKRKTMGLQPEGE
jgi:hypothetical protein